MRNDRNTVVLWKNNNANVIRSTICLRPQTNVHKHSRTLTHQTDNRHQANRPRSAQRGNYKNESRTATQRYCHYTQRVHATNCVYEIHCDDVGRRIRQFRDEIPHHTFQHPTKSVALALTPRVRRTIRTQTAPVPIARNVMLPQNIHNPHRSCERTHSLQNCCSRRCTHTHT